jgi:hypothetical protein
MASCKKGISHYEEVEGVEPGIFLNIFLAFITTTNQTISTPLLFNWNKEAVEHRYVSRRNRVSSPAKCGETGDGPVGSRVYELGFDSQLATPH